MDATITFKDGTSHTYQGVPDGTSPDVVEAQALKEFGKPVASLSGGAAPAPEAKPGFLERLKNAVYVPPEQRQDASLGDAVVGGITGAPAEIGRQVGQNLSNLKQHSDEAMAETDPNRIMFDRGNSGVGVWDAMGAVMAPITGALTSIVGRPVEQQAGINRNVVGDALSLAVPLGGEAKAADAVTAAGDIAKATSAIKPMAAEAHAAGYVLPPKMISDKPGLFANVMAGWSGKIKTAQAASAKNQEVTNALAAKTLGLPEDATLDAPTFKALRATAGQAYAAVPKALPQVTADSEFTDAVSSLGGASADAAKSFPSITKNQGIVDLSDELKSATQFPTDVGLEVIKKLRTDSVANLKNYTDASKIALGKAQRTAANAMEDLIERNLSATGDANLVSEYKAARQQIAKSYDVEAATNPATGNVDARKIAALGNKGKPLSGELDMIAKVANAFPKAFQSADKFGDVEPFSVLDLGGAAITAAHGNPGVAAAFLGRPIARSVILSKPVQNALASAPRGATGINLNELRRAPAVNALYQIGNQTQQ